MRQYAVKATVKLILFFTDIPFQFVEATRGGGYVLKIQGYTFFKMNKNANYWYCSQRVYKKCRAKVRINSSYTEIIVGYLEHTHPPRVIHSPNEFSNKR
ncbi:jg8391 [Pararge aegeria aegeria]|uniref:Jg8391 protein n=1 Tax=Pararge aegeria aegeria TaxID=348720 RepID=A0A8S4SG16_9NEOP|nr:jg8391 [Pararge aegeria aegeria]